MILDDNKKFKLARRRPINILPKTTSHHAAADHLKKATTLFGAGMEASSDEVSAEVCDTKNKNFECNIHPCKRIFKTITALRHHLKHFHKPCNKQDKPNDQVSKPHDIR